GPWRRRHVKRFWTDAGLRDRAAAASCRWTGRSSQKPDCAVRTEEIFERLREGLVRQRSAFFPSPLVGEGQKKRRLRGLFFAERLSMRNQPLTQTSSRRLPRCPLP